MRRRTAHNRKRNLKVTQQQLLVSEEKRQNTKSVKHSKQTNAKRNTSKPFEPLQNRDRSQVTHGNNIWDNEEWTQIRGQRKKENERTRKKHRCWNKQPPNLEGSSELNKITNRIDPKVINLSSTKLDNSQIDLLIKGFKFTPTPTPNTTILKSDIQQFSRRLRLPEYFGNGKFDDGSLVRNESTFTP
ncbi:Hypothetical predicted protein [Mytilus galloprovincialis]|uniref:Uncharacterized protein n=1 Tax=Mytilus galloprovincialis TaxID=29158 RepID=A0A8B6C971_MYTGA|nr:Hypothetical predicted protein [Mytilus galloprovincialis]